MWGTNSIRKRSKQRISTYRYARKFAKSIAWALCNFPVFLKSIIKELLSIDMVRIKYQEFEKDKGITDLKITDDDLFYIIIEAKRG